ncbi:zinc finger CCCH-type with G patch domain-containing protein isoform X4 [Mucor ambiguus]|uniref:Zinc finger CCCH-type with G patch domain-containing protein n=1 Tax=Mucor ambiguus TaxID=91626 RepID=A0A0C9M8B9_9FUNG|nr:zinc finger CCCH-type with G patch domain-containing protein isoform X4 [Mucor ambiguus]
MSAEELANSDSLTEQDILLLLESKDLAPEVLELIENYQQARSTSDSYNNTTAVVEEATSDNNGHSEFTIGDRCAITFSYENDMVLLPAVIVDIAEPTTRVLILTPITRDTIPCSQYFSQSACKKEPCPYSHGYTLPSEFVAPFEALGTHDTDTLLAQLQYGKRVWCKEKDSQDIWQLGNIIDQLHGPRWRVRLKDSKKRIRVDMEHIMPFKSLLEDEDGNNDQQDMGEWSESDHGDTTDTESVAEDDPVIAVSRPDDAFGGWESHSTGFASKMMKKMGYIQGQGLGADGTGRLHPIQARPYSGSSLDQRPGLGLVEKKKQQSKKKKSREPAKVEQEEMDMFGLMNSLLERQQTEEKTSATTAQQRLHKSTDTRQANQTRAKLQSQLDTAKHEYTHAAEALRRNQGTAMEAQFRERLKSATESYHRLNKQMAEVNHHVKRTKQQKDMYTF